MQQLDYWFDRYPDGFWKFLEPSPNHERYKPGSSWVEEMGMSVAEFRTAFDKIAYRYKSKGEYDKSENIFNDRFYASYVDRRSNLTYYVRNHALLDQKLEDLVMRYSVNPDEGQAQQPRKAPISNPNTNTAFTVNPQTTVPVNAESTGQEKGIQQVGEFDSHIPRTSVLAAREMQATQLPTTELTKEITRQPQQTSTVTHVAATSISETDRGGGLDVDLVFPIRISNRERNELLNLMQLCPVDQQQNVLDELEGNRASGSLRKGIVPLAIALVKKASQGAFGLSAGIAVAALRENRINSQNLLRKNMDVGPAMLPEVRAIRGYDQAIANIRAHLRPGRISRAHK